MAQKPDDNNKLYALHAPEVVCISKGKAHKRYEFGCKVSSAATNREGLFITAMAFEGNPYDGHTLNATAAKTKEMTEVANKTPRRKQRGISSFFVHAPPRLRSRLVASRRSALLRSRRKRRGMYPKEIQRLYVDKGYRGHDDHGKATVMISGNKRGLSPTMKRCYKRRSAIEPMIGHANNDRRLGRNYLLGADGDKINAILAAAGHNLRLVLRPLALLFARILEAVFSIFFAKNRHTGRYNNPVRIKRYLIKTNQSALSIA